MGFTIKQVSSLTGIPADSLRYYDKLGIVSPKRHENGYRYYNEKDLSDLRYITVMKYAQFTLSEIKTVIGLADKEPSPECNEICKILLNSKVDRLKNDIKNYKNIVKLLAELLPMLDDIEAYCANQGQIDAFIKQIYDDIQQGNIMQSGMDAKQIK